MKLAPTLLDKALQEKYKAIESTFLKEWNESNFKKVQNRITFHFSFADTITHTGIKPSGTFAMLDKLIGFAYTSTSLYAGLWVCNVDLTNTLYPNYRYIGFALTNTNQVYAILWDKDENEILISI